MNTKMLFLLLLSLFITNGHFSIATTNGKRASIETTTSQPAPSNQDKPGDEVPPMDLSTPRPFQKVHTPNSDDDGKHHHFHFDRITCIGSRRLLLLCVSKAILIISQVCCFIYCVTHTFH